MQITKEALLERYGKMETHKLVRLIQTGELTSDAKEALAQTLAERGESFEDISAAANPYREPKSDLIPKTPKHSMTFMYRTVVVSSQLIFAFYFFVLPYIEYSYVSDETLGGLDWGGAGSMLAYGYEISYFFAFIWLFIYTGLYFFHRWARKALLWFMLIGILTGPLFGLIATTGLSGSINYLLSVIDGFILALCYFTSISQRFDSGQPELAPQAAPDLTSTNQ